MHRSTIATKISRHELAKLARDSDLVLSGVAVPEPFVASRDFVVEHIRRGYAAGMDWFTSDRAHASADPRTLHETVKSIVSVGVPFWTGEVDPPTDGVLRGRIARYAWGRDYHTTLRQRMKRLVGALEDALGRNVEARTLVDTARVFDRAVAARAGIGWFGKNSMIIVPRHGSWVMLGEIYLDVTIQPDLPLHQDCGRCSICIERCPTGAIAEPYTINAPRCISYLTIEERGPIPIELRSLMGDWVFGCDVCQNVCPYTGAAGLVDDPSFAPATVDNAFPSLAWLATMTEEEFRSVYSGTAVTRAKRRGMARNAAIALGNSGDKEATPVLEEMLLNHDEPLARGHAAWALGRLDGTSAHRILTLARQNERDQYVLTEIDCAVQRSG